MAPVPFAPDGRLDEFIHERVRVRVFLAELLPRLGQQIVDRDRLGFPPFFCTAPHPRCGGFLAFRQELLQSGGRVLDINGAVAGRGRVAQHPCHGLADGGQRGGAEEAGAAVVEGDALGLDVHEEADHEAPVEERAGADQGVRHGVVIVAAAAGRIRRRLLLERVLDGDFGRKGGQGGRFGVGGVGAEFRGDEALDAGCAGGFHEEELLVDDGGAEGRYHGVLALKGAGQGVEGVVVDGVDGDGGREGMGAGLAGEYCDLESCGEEGIQDSRTKITGSLLASDDVKR